jgi:hypothetical protein
MPEGFYITCGCGYEMRIPEADVGADQECVNCGAELDTQPSALTSEKDSAKEDVVAPLEVSSFVHNQRPAGTKPIISSPFEDDDELGKPTPSTPPASTPPSPRSEEPLDYAASIFEDDSDEEEESLASVKKPDPSKIRVYHDPEHTAAYQGNTETETCPRCGNVYRGDWDKNLTGGETICFICSNQAVDGLPERWKEKQPVAQNPVTQSQNWSASVNVDIPEGPIEEKFWLFNPESDEFRVMIYVLAFGMILLTLILVVFTDLEMPVQSDQSVADLESGPTVAADVAEPELPGWANAIYWSWQVFIIFAGQFLSIYMVLRLTDRLPHGKIINDFVVVGYTMLLLGMMTALYVLFASTIGRYMMGPLLMMIVNVVCLLPCIWIMRHVLDFRIRDFLYLAFISGFVHSFLYLISLFFYAGLANIAL